MNNVFVVTSTPAGNTQDENLIITDRQNQAIDRVASIEGDVLVWAIIDGFLLIAILCGNILTILAVRFSRRLRSVISNHFVLSLAISDILVGLTLPYHLAFYLGFGLGSSKWFCLLRFFFVIVACTVSIWSLIAIALDRYIAICYSLHYGRYMTRKVTLILMGVGWIVGFLIAAVPVLFNRWDSAAECEFDEIFHSWYMAGVITPMFSAVWFCMLFVYWRIWREAAKQVKQLRTTGLQKGSSDWKSVQVVLLILGCFTVCWLPYFIVACAQIFDILENSSPIVYKAAFSLAMSNSALNPLIYAWKNSGFRKAFGRLLRCKSPDTMEPSQSMRSNLHRKSSSVQHQDQINGAHFSTPPFVQRSIKIGAENGALPEPNMIMGITIEEDESNLSPCERPTALCNHSYHSNQQIDQIHEILGNQQTNNQIDIQVENELTQVDGVNVTDNDGKSTRTSINGSITMKTGNLIVNKREMLENYLQEQETEKKIFKENFLNFQNNITTSAIQGSKFKSKSANCVAITTNVNFDCNNNPAKHPDHAASKDKFLSSFKFSKGHNSSSFCGVNTIQEHGKNHFGGSKTSFKLR